MPANKKIILKSDPKLFEKTTKTGIGMVEVLQDE